jgi:titin
LNGLSAGALVDGLRITAGSSTVRGLVINKFGQTNGADGIELQGGGNNVIEGNFIGVDVTGGVTDPDSIPGNGDEFGNSGSGVFINGSANNTIGGIRPGSSCSGPCNIISGAGRRSSAFSDAHGVEIGGAGATGNVVTGNIIGLDINGNIDFGNRGDGVHIAGVSNNTIGGTAGGAGNVISSNDNYGVTIGGGPEAGANCSGNTDNDGDGLVNDGCPQAGGTSEAGAQCSNTTNDDSPDDALVNDGCPAVQVATGNHLEGNYVGTTSDGLNIPPPPASKSLYGILIDGAPGNFIGGTASGAGNLVSANLVGIQVQGSGATGTQLQGNHVGTNAPGDGDRGNLSSGIVIANGSSNNTIGGTVAGARNVVSGNDLQGIEINSGTATGNLVQGNYIGTDVTGAEELPNGQVGGGGTGRGIRVNGSPANTIGGSAAARNIISGNIRYGIEVTGGGANGNVIQSNYIGTDPLGTSPVGNRESGIVVNGAPNTTIGGTAAAARNVVSGNGQASVMYVAPGIIVLNSAATGTQIRGNLVGTDVTGTAALSNLGIGIVVIGAPSNTIGGTAPGDRNVISGNGIHGVEIDSAGGTGNQVLGNNIGLDINGTAPIGNGGNGIYISDASGNTIGSTAAGGANLISANGSMGVEILGIASSNNVVEGNFIGTDVTGGVDFGNSQHGVFINGATNNTIGGASASARNLISGNGTGVFIQNGNSTGNIVQGNFIGTTADGTGQLGNTFDGVRIGGNASNNTVGGAGSVGNTIHHNGANGVLIDSGSGNTVGGNSISSNTSLGINLGLDAVTANDTGDGDTGANGLQNYPDLTSANSNLSGTTVGGTLNTSAGGSFNLRFFSDVSCDGSGNGEGRTFLGSASVNTDGSGNANINVTLPAIVQDGQFVSATATDAGGSTSEFSQCQVVTGVPQPPVKQGDVDCESNVNSVDSLKILRNAASLGYTQTEPCPDIGTVTSQVIGDVDCDGLVNSIDSLKVLRYAASLGYTQNEPCTDIGQNLP